ncbi:hypothetical protein PVK06_028960 [Gossypium arboreum]|uniref:MADS-box domain-containing protein n=1 Tax=Gossypium arboreum TaxID=29729 RepID=A0ABR0P5A5_GOSAR|nr:hypothetical protein PVK06_028960 [Gossypium arboreum]
MTRKKINLAYITNDLARKAAYKKRKKGLMKKVCELGTLYGIDACTIINNPYESQPKVWPSLWESNNLNLGDLNDLNKLLDEKIRDIDMRIDKLSKTLLNPQCALSLLSSSVIALAPMMMVTPEAMSRSSMEEIGQTKVDNMELMNNNPP